MEKAYFIYQNSDIKNISQDIDLLYYWDWECEFNFLAAINNKKLIHEVNSSEKRIVLVTPHVSQKSIELFRKYISDKDTEFLNMFEEIVINDFWTLKIIQEYFPSDIKITFWNYLFNQRKDPLLKYNLKDSGDISINLEMYERFFQNNSITAIELYNTFGVIGVNNLNNIRKHIYYPYVVYTTSRHCYRSMIDANIESLKIIDSCSGCKWKEHIAFKQNATDDIVVYNSWNKDFYQNEGIVNVENMDRVIYNYDIIDS